MRVVVFAAVGLITVAAVIIGAGRHLPGTTLLVGAAEGPRVSISVYALVIGVTCAVAAWVLVLAGLFFADWRVRLPGLVLVGTGAAAERHVLGRQLSFFGAAPGLAALAGVLTLGALTIAAEVWPRRDEALRIDTRSPPWTRLIFIAIVVVVLVVYAGQAIRLGGLASLGQGSVAVLEQAGPGPGQSGAASPWTRPPEQPAPYRLPARLSDMLHGWLDGRRGIPELPNGRTSAVSMAAAPDTETDDPKLSDSPDVAKPQIRPPTPWTPRIGVLVRRSRELIEEERIRFADDWSELKRRSIGHQLLLDPLKEQVTALEERLNQARVQPSNAELGKRRLAEQDAGSRPDTLVSARRQAAWDRRLSTVEEQHQSATAELARAAYAFRLHEDLIRERAEVARAAARRHHEFALRRVATYLQQLVRKHPRGAELNELLMDYRVRPDLPEWARESAEAESAIKSVLTNDSTPSSGNDPGARDEVNGQ